MTPAEAIELLRRRNAELGFDRTRVQELHALARRSRERRRAAYERNPLLARLGAWLVSSEHEHPYVVTHVDFDEGMRYKCQHGCSAELDFTAEHVFSSMQL